MKLTVLKEELLEAVSTVGRLATTRATLPILQNILLTVSKKGIELRATDLEQTLQVDIEGSDLEIGSLTVPARLLSEYLQNNPDEAVTLIDDDTTLIIKSKNSNARIKGMPAEEYPTLPSVKIESEVIIQSSVLNEVITHTLFAATSDETRPILTGLLFRFNEKKLTIVGTDGYRLARYIITVDSQINADYVIPKRTLQELVRINSEQEVRLGFAASQFQINTNGVTLTSRIIEGSFPAFEAIIPKKEALALNLNSSLLNQNLKLASLFSRDSAYSTRVDVEGDKLKITAISPQLGEAKNEIKLEERAEQNFTVSLNAQYLIDALTNLSGDIVLGFTDQKSPITIRNIKSDSYLYLVMPLRGE